MTSLPSALCIIDPTKERIALAEAKRVGIPVTAIVDTNCNPDEIDHPIPANDDAIKAIKLICNKIADAVIEAKSGGMGVPSEEEAEESLEELEAKEDTESIVLAPDEEGSKEAE